MFSLTLNCEIKVHFLRCHCITNVYFFVCFYKIQCYQVQFSSTNILGEAEGMNGIAIQIKLLESEPDNYCLTCSLYRAILNLYLQRPPSHILRLRHILLVILQ